MRSDVKNNLLFFHLIAICIALSIYVAGRFGFFDILGLKRLFELLLFTTIGFLGILSIVLFPRLCLDPFFLLPLSYFIFQFYWNPDPLILGDLSISIMVVGTLLAFGPKFSDLVLRYAIRIATFFAILGIIEFCILLRYPSLVSHILLFYDYYSGSTLPLIENFLQILGLSDGTSYHLWGMSVTRLRSFASEPSLLVGYFLVPGALALTYERKFIWCGIACIFFCICSFAGSVYAALGFSSVSMLLLIIKKRNVFLLVPFIILIVFIWVLNYHFDELILLSKVMGGDYDFFDKTNSANLRFSYIRDFIPKILSSPFGLEEELHQPLGLLLGSAAHGGIFGFILICIILFKLYTNLGFLLIKNNLHKLQKIGLLIIYGSLITGILYLDNCFIQINGFTLLLLTYNRLSKFTTLKESSQSVSH